MNTHTKDLGLIEPTWDDAVFLYALRTEEEVARWSFKRRPTWDEHVQYMNTLLMLKDFYIIMYKDEPVGCVHIDPRSELSISFVPTARRMGIGRMVIRALQRERPKLIARVIIGNTSALKFFSACGFELTGADEEPRPHVVMEWTRVERGLYE